MGKNFANSGKYFQNNIDFSFPVLILTEFLNILFLNSHEPRICPAWNTAVSSIIKLRSLFAQLTYTVVLTFLCFRNRSLILILLFCNIKICFYDFYNKEGQSKADNTKSLKNKNK